MNFLELLKKYNGGILRGAAIRLSKKIGKSESTVSRIASGALAIPETLAIKIASEFEISVEELMDCFPSQKQRLLKIHDSAQKLERLHSSLNDLEKSITNRPELIPAPMGHSQAIPFFGNVCAGGTNFSFDAIPENYLPISLPIPKGRRVGAWLIKGDCMDDGSVDAIRQGDTIVVIEQDYAENKKIVVAMLNGEITVKQILHHDGNIELKPKNPRHKPIIVNTNDFKILGVVIYSFRRH